jgi:hypothetical protein
VLKLLNRQERIRNKGFSLHNEHSISNPDGTLDFSKIRVGVKSLEDAVLTLGDLRKANPSYADKATVLKAIHTGDLGTMRGISNFFYKTSGIYS